MWAEKEKDVSPPLLEQQTLLIGGVYTMRDVQQLEQTLQHISGVTEARGMPPTATITVTFDPTRTVVSELVAIAAAAGYELMLNKKAPPDRDDEDVERALAITWANGLSPDDV